MMNVHEIERPRDLILQGFTAGDFPHLLLPFRGRLRSGFFSCRLGNVILIGPPLLTFSVFLEAFAFSFTGRK